MIPVFVFPKSFKLWLRISYVEVPLFDSRIEF